jgi:hypothetical protein
MLPYPRVLGELATLEAVHVGRSIARYGDGELKIAKGADAKSQAGNPELARRLRAILLDAGERCLVAIPNIATDATPKLDFWRQYRDQRWTRFYSRGVTYGSSFITRPDSAPWIDNADYWQRVIDLWRGLDVVLVRGSSKSLCAADLVLAKSVDEIVASRQHAWADYPHLMRRLAGEKRRVILCLGATATVLAYDLAALGVHALDLGHIGMFLRKEGRFDRESFPA